jgi:hypothetical protein
VALRPVGTEEGGWGRAWGGRGTGRSAIEILRPLGQSDLEKADFLFLFATYCVSRTKKGKKRPSVRERSGEGGPTTLDGKSKTKNAVLHLARAAYLYSLELVPARNR